MPPFWFPLGKVTILPSARCRRIRPCSSAWLSVRLSNAVHSASVKQMRQRRRITNSPHLSEPHVTFEACIVTTMELTQHVRKTVKARVANNQRKQRAFILSHQLAFDCRPDFVRRFMSGHGSLHIAVCTEGVPPLPRNNPGDLNRNHISVASQEPVDALLAFRLPCIQPAIVCRPVARAPRPKWLRHSQRPPRSAGDRSCGSGNHRAGPRQRQSRRHNRRVADAPVRRCQVACQRRRWRLRQRTSE